MKHKEKSLANNAELMSEETIDALFTALKNRKNFILEAGAGAGKTYSLIQALRHILENKADYLPRTDQKVACLTYTRVARDEIKARTDEDPTIFADTLHGFLWEMISPYQKALASALPSLKNWQLVHEQRPDFKELPVVYDLGIRGIHQDRITLHHDDIPELAIQLFGNEKFRSLIADRFPVIFIDEYQDTPLGLADAILSGWDSDRITPIVGFFGDHWQQIYDKTCGAIKHSSLEYIPKNANFRSDKSVVDFLNHLRPELPQAPKANAESGTVTIFHTNEWPGKRLTRSWKGQISHEATQSCLRWVQEDSRISVWAKDSKNLKVLMLTHRAIANELGYPSLPEIFHYNDAFTHKEDPVIEFLVDTLEPAIQAFVERKFGELFRILGSKGPTLRAPKDKQLWVKFFESLNSKSITGTVGDVLELSRQQSFFAIPTKVADRHRQLTESLQVLTPDETFEKPRSLDEYEKLLAVPYAEIRALRQYFEDGSLFSTQHAVKGAEFDDVIVVVGRGWSKYNFAKMIADHNSEQLQNSTFQHSRNLFYVAASRAKHNLAFLFVQELSDDAIRNLNDWAGQENVISISFDEPGLRHTLMEFEQR
ncbi:AAA family ATPase [Corynebacterium pelargi]|uniref:DNA helicase IV n=1 Tax=Corynebacterium pelargi TaxID=1471400 RepID=A0A410W6X5_9CORY|nr:AAA family ATPase [Corynebacterium pelargi]QAU51700.1 DNA helicase IV [Corynebacterium pelargi]GGG80599.1 DNA helicase [Corynebacterium pelargi]